VLLYRVKTSMVAVLCIQLVNTMLAAAFAGIGVFGIRRYQEEPYELGIIANAILSGLVAVTAPCAVIDSWEAAIIGCVLLCCQFGV
jgi:ammonium transporter, Amt family